MSKKGGIKKGELVVIGSGTKLSKSLFKLKEGDKDWATSCESCGAVPTVHPTGQCGPCCFGEAETAGGNW